MEHLWVARLTPRICKKLPWWMAICFAWRRSSNIKGTESWYSGKDRHPSTTVGWRNVTYWGRDERRNNWWVTRSGTTTNPTSFPTHCRPSLREGFLYSNVRPSTIAGNQVSHLFKTHTLWKREAIFTRMQRCDRYYRHVSDREHGDVSDLGIASDDPTFQLWVTIFTWPYPATATEMSFRKIIIIISRYVYLTPNDWRVQDEKWDWGASLYLMP